MDRQTYRYIRVKFPETSKFYTYRCDFMVREGDRLVMPTCYGDKRAVVKDTSADRDNGFPTAKWAKGFQARGRELDPWPKHFRVRHEDRPDLVLYANQTRACRPGEPPDIDHPPAEGALRLAKARRYNLGADLGTDERTVLVQRVHVNCRCVLPGRQQGKNATKQAELMRAYGAGDRTMIEFLEKRRDDLRAELAEVEGAIDEARMRERLAEIERTLEREREADAYRKKFAGVEVDGELVEEAVRLRDRLKYGADDAGSDEGGEG